MDTRPIGFFDSGLGGLTAVRALRAMLPEENILYFADTGRMPYGGRSREQLRRMARQDLDFVGSFGPKAILVACGTVSSNAPDLLEANPIPSFGVLKASVEALARIPGNGPLGVIATEASIRSGAFQSALAEACPGREILALPCPRFVPLIESGHTDPADPLLREAMDCLAPLKGAELLLLGCTHYGLISPAIRDYLGPGTRLVEASVCAARAVREHLLARDMTGGRGEARYFTSGDPAEFDAAAGSFLGCGDPVASVRVPVMEA